MRSRQYQNVWLRVRRAVTTTSRNHQLTNVSRRSAADVPQRSEHHGCHCTHDVAKRQEASRTEPDKHLRTRKTWPPSHVTNADKFVTSTTTTTSVGVPSLRLLHCVKVKATVDRILLFSESVGSLAYVCPSFRVVFRCFFVYLRVLSSWWINISMNVWWNAFTREVWAAGEGVNRIKAQYSGCSPRQNKPSMSRNVNFLSGPSF